MLPYYYYFFFRYLEAFLGLLSALLKKIQYTSNASQLKEIDDVELNDDVRNYIIFFFVIYVLIF